MDVSAVRSVLCWSMTMIVGGHGKVHDKVLSYNVIEELEHTCES